MSRMSYEDAIAGGHWSPSAEALVVDQYLEEHGPETNPEYWTFSAMGGWKYVGPDVGKSSRQEYADFITTALSEENHPDNPNNLFGEYTSWGYEEGSPVITEPGSGEYLGPNWRNHFITDLLRLMDNPSGSDPRNWKRYDIFNGYTGVDSPFNQSTEFKQFLSDANWKMDWDRNRVIQEWQKAADAWEIANGYKQNTGSNSVVNSPSTGSNNAVNQPSTGMLSGGVGAEMPPANLASLFSGLQRGVGRSGTWGAGHTQRVSGRDLRNMAQNAWNSVKPKAEGWAENNPEAFNQLQQTAQNFQNDPGMFGQNAQSMRQALIAALEKNLLG